MSVSIILEIGGVRTVAVGPMTITTETLCHRTL